MMMYNCLEAISYKYTPVRSALGRLKQENFYEFEASLGSIASVSYILVAVIKFPA